MTWGDGMVEWIEGNTAYISSVFSWNLDRAYMRCVYWKSAGYHVKAGGSTVTMNPDVFREFDLTGTVDALSHHNPDAVFTSRGCIRRCGFCMVPTLEGSIRELDQWDDKPVICDNNLLATSQDHFDRVIDRLLEAGLSGIDFNQGLDARILSDHHARQLSRLPKDTVIRLAWDAVKTEALYMGAVNRLVEAGIRRTQLRTFVLIGYKDTPEDALYRLEKLRSQKILANPMRYQPINTPRKNNYVGENWNNTLLNRFMRYWSNTRIFGKLSFNQYLKFEDSKRRIADPTQPELRILDYANRANERKY